METYPYADWLDTFVKKTVVESPIPSSVPPQGCYAVTNFYVIEYIIEGESKKKLVVEYDNTPTP